MTVKEMHARLDENRDGQVEKHEFVGQMRRLHVPGLVPADLGLVFDALDVNNDGTITLEEFGMFLEGAKRNRDARLKEMDPELKSSIE